MRDTANWKQAMAPAGPFTRGEVPPVKTKQHKPHPAAPAKVPAKGPAEETYSAPVKPVAKESE